MGSTGPFTTPLSQSSGVSSPTSAPGMGRRCGWRRVVPVIEALLSVPDEERWSPSVSLGLPVFLPLRWLWTGHRPRPQCSKEPGGSGRACLCVPDGTVDDRATGRLAHPPRPPGGLRAGPQHPQFAGVCPSRRPQGQWGGEEDRPGLHRRGLLLRSGSRCRHRPTRQSRWSLAQAQEGGGLMPLAPVRDSGTAGLPAARETRKRGLAVSEIFADNSGNGRTPAGRPSSRRGRSRRR